MAKRGTPPGGWTKASALALAFVTAALLTACAGPPVEPAIAFTYNFGDTAFQGFLQEELDRTRPDGGVRLRVTGAEFRREDHPELTTHATELLRASELAADPRVLAVVGPGGSREALQTAPIYREAGVPNLVPNATSRLLAGLSPWTFVLAPNDSVQGEFIGAFADSTLGAERAIVLYVPDEYGIGLAAGTEAAFARRGVTLLDRFPMRITHDCLESPEGEGPYEQLVAQAARRGVPDVAVVAARGVETGCAARALRARFPDVRVLGGDGTYLDDTFLTRAGPAAEGTYLVAFWHPDLDRPGSREFVRGFTARVRRAPRHVDAVFYDGVRLAAAAVWSAGADREAMRAWLEGLGSTHPPFVGIASDIGFGPGKRHGILMTRVRGTVAEVVGR